MFGETLHQTLDIAAAKSPDAVITFPTGSASFTIAGLASSSVTMAVSLLDAGIAPTDRVGILCPNEPAFFQALFALSRAGAVSCPLPLPVTLRDFEGYVARLTRVIEVAGIRHLVVTDGFGNLIDALDDLLPDVTLLRIGTLAGGPGARDRLPEVGPEALAIVQFTSGSTAVPKGVRLTHANVLACLDAIVTGVDMGRPDDVGAIWLPLYHDMGLFGSLSAMLIGMPVWVWSPVSFVKNPLRWLTEFSASGGTICPCPNFAYDHLVEAVSAEEAAGIDLRRWRIAFNGAEAIATDSVDAFCGRFATSGFRPEAMFAVYGLAEATLAVTFPPLGRLPVYDWVDAERLAGERLAVPVDRSAPRTRGIVGVGRPVLGMRVRIADPTTGEVMPDRRVGEIQVRGASVTSGYLADDAVVQPFTPDGWLRTGDLGYDAAGELFVTGRIKEMIVLRGANYYPEDVESIVRELDGVYKRRCVAFADNTGGTETMVLAAETRLDSPEDRCRLTTDILTRVSRAIGLAELDVHLLPPRSIPRTTSGKFQRLATREMIRSS